MEQPTQVKRLYRSRKNRVLAGVCGGLGEYLNIDPVVIRLIWVAISLVWGFGIILYIIAALIIPEEPTTTSPTTTYSPQPPPTASTDRSRSLTAILSIIILVAGFTGLTLTIIARFIINDLARTGTIPIYLIRLLRLNQIMAAITSIILIVVSIVILVKLR